MTVLRLEISNIVHVDSSSVLFQATQQTYNCPLLYKLYDRSQLSILQQNLKKVVDVNVEEIVDKFIPLVTLIRFEAFVNQIHTESRKRPCRPALTL